ncbi:MAG: hypothetical protein E6H75_15910 [Betaproteobacteria bacterium]|nr:MAG: hypothetical protein E6H75_15910 [Betaproteobacteria bacterium]
MAVASLGSAVDCCSGVSPSRVELFRRSGDVLHRCQAIARHVDDMIEALQHFHLHHLFRPAALAGDVGRQRLHVAGVRVPDGLLVRGELEVLLQLREDQRKLIDALLRLLLGFGGAVRAAPAPASPLR